MNCIHCNSPPLHLLTLQKHRQNAAKCCRLFSSNSTNRHSNIIVSKVQVLPMNVEAFPTSITLAVAKPANTQVLIQTSALLIFFYLIANFVVPQFISKGFGFDEVDEKQKLNNIDSVDEVKASPTRKRGFNSTKPK